MQSDGGREREEKRLSPSLLLAFSLFFLSFCAHASCNVFRPPVRLLVAPSFIVVKSPFVEHCVTELQLRVRFVCRQRHGGGTPFSSPPSFAGFSPGPAAVVLEPPPLPPFPSRSLRLPRREARERGGRLMVALAPGRDRACLAGWGWCRCRGEREGDRDTCDDSE